MSHRYLIAVIAALALAMTACNGQERSASKAAPVGDRAVLEELAQNFERLAGDLPESPSRLPPEKRKEFVARVFDESGYDYSQTLQRLATTEWDVKNQNARDLADLLLMPHRGMGAGESLDGVYSADEIKQIRAVQKRLEQ